MSGHEPLRITPVPLPAGTVAAAEGGGQGCPLPLRQVLARAADRWIFVFMAGLFLATTLLGFIPDSLAQLGAIRAGLRPPYPFAVHAHAATMGAWLLLVLAQAILAATGRRALHRTLGLVSLALVPAMLAAMPAAAVQWWNVLDLVPPEQTEAVRTFLANILFEQIRMGTLLTIFVGWALLVRGRDAGTHKRLMILATLMPMSAAIDRIAGTLRMPDWSVASYDLQYACLLLWLAPALLHDVLRRGRPHRAYVIGIAMVLPFAIVSHIVWNEPWWTATAARWMGHGA